MKGSKAYIRDMKVHNSVATENTIFLMFTIWSVMSCHSGYWHAPSPPHRQTVSPSCTTNAHDNKNTRRWSWISSMRHQRYISRRLDSNKLSMRICMVNERYCTDPEMMAQPFWKLTQIFLITPENCPNLETLPPLELYYPLAPPDEPIEETCAKWVQKLSQQVLDTFEGHATTSTHQMDSLIPCRVQLPVQIPKELEQCDSTELEGGTSQM